MEVIKNGSQASVTLPADYFTGTARLDQPFQQVTPGTLKGASVTFEPGARTAWHRHPLGQTLIVTAGRGFVQLEGEAAQEILPGDVVVIAPEERHWHGAAQETSMTHIALQEAKDGEVVTWEDHVTDEQYLG